MDVLVRDAFTELNRSLYGKTRRDMAPLASDVQAWKTSEWVESDCTERQWFPQGQ